MRALRIAKTHDVSNLGHSSQGKLYFGRTYIIATLKQNTFFCTFHHNHYTVMRRKTTGIRSEKRVVRRFRCCADVVQCTYTNLESITYYTPRLYGIVYCS